LDVDLFRNKKLGVETLLTIRIAPARKGLGRIGRFDQTRARERWLASFDPSLRRFIEMDG